MLVVRVGSIAVVNVDFVASSQPQRYTQLGALPEGMVPVTGLGAGWSHSAALAYRGAVVGGEGGYVYVNDTGLIAIWTSTTAPYYVGQVVVPLASW